MNSFNIMGIDPGSRNVGVTIFGLNIQHTNNSIFLDIDKITTFNIAVEEERDIGIHDGLLDRTNKIARLIKSIYLLYEPLMVGMESSFINISRMAAVIPLSRSIHAIEHIIYSTDRYAKILSMPPGVIKKVFKSKQIGKDAVLEALKNKPHLVKKVEMSRMTDHEVDSVAIAYTLLEYIKTTEGMICMKYLEI